MYVLYCAEVNSEFAGPIASLRNAHAGNAALRKNVAAVASRWQHCVRFDLLKVGTSYLPLQRRTRCHSTNWPVLFSALWNVNLTSRGNNGAGFVFGYKRYSFGENSNPDQFGDIRTRGNPNRLMVWFHQNVIFLTHILIRIILKFGGARTLTR